MAKQDRIENGKKTGGAGHVFTVIGKVVGTIFLTAFLTALIFACLFAVYVPVLLFGDSIQAAVMLTGLVIAVVLGALASKSPKLRWLSEFIMAFSMIGGMVSSIFWTNLFQ